MKFTIKDNIKRFYPTAAECRVNNNLVCTEEGCSSIFMSESNLNLHLAKTHKKANLNVTESFKKQYFCPEVNCVYNEEKYFKELKVLRNHYMVKHSSEPFVCLTCLKMFSQENVLNRHSEYCGVDFTCPVCQAAYPLYESLQTHGRRKKHVIPIKSHFKLDKVSKSETIIETPRPILPKGSYSVILFPSSEITKFSQESQTYSDAVKYKSKMTQVCRFLDSTQNNRQTQTSSNNNYLTVETQTIGDYNHSPKNQNIIFNDTLSQKSSKTQTDVIESKHSSSNTSTTDEFVVKSIETSTSSTQTGDSETHNYSASTHTHDSIYTDTSDLLTDGLDVNMDTFEYENCHMETQTDFIFDDVMFGCDYMSNMYTQTCDQILTDLGFSNIQTQTAIDDMLKSVESQTVMSRKRHDIEDRDMTHMETQTDMEFREMLEVINS